MIWSYEALSQVANGPTFVCEGNNLQAEAYGNMIANGSDFINAVAKACG